MRWSQHVEAEAPEFLAKHGYKSAAGLRNAPFAYAYDLGDVTWLEYLGKEQKMDQLFGSMMRQTGEAEPTRNDGTLYPVKEKLHSTNRPDDVLIVDLGCRSGHDLEWFRRNHPELKR